MLLRLSKRAILASILVLIFLFNSISFIPDVAFASHVYDFQDETNNKAFEGSDLNMPPLTRDVGAEISPLEYDYINSSNNMRAVFSTSNTSITHDYHRFKFKIFEPLNIISQIYVMHEGFGNGRSDTPQNDGVNLYIWNHNSGSWQFIDTHGEGDTAPPVDGIADGLITQNIQNYIDNDGNLYLLAQAKEVGESSCPLLYTFNGEQFVFVSDLYNRGILAVPNFPPQPEDYAKIESDQLEQKDNIYKVQITQEYDEISYLDNIDLIAIDHPPEVELYPSLLKGEEGRILTVNKHQSTPISAVDKNGEDILQQIKQKDGVYTTAQPYELNIVELDLGALSTAQQIKLVISAYTSWDNNKVFDGKQKPVGRFIQVKDVNGDWSTILEGFKINTPSALPRTYVLDLTGKFLTNDHSVRIGFYPDVKFDYIGVDTSAQKEVQSTVLPITDADLHFRGYSSFKGLPSIPNYYDQSITPPAGYSHPTGSFTRFGDVLPLLETRDDKFVILHHGDEISINFEYLPVSEGLERAFLFYSWGYYKNPLASTGQTVNPLPFNGMSSYPYPESENYPNDAEHTTYLTEYNTRQYDSATSYNQAREHHTIWTDYVKVEVFTGGPVGGIVMSVNTLSLLAPYLALAGLVIAVSAIVFVKRRKA